MPPIVALVSAVGAVVGSVATAIVGAVGLSSAVWGAISLGVSVGRSLLSGKPKIANSRENLDRLRASIDPRTPRKTAVGETAMKVDAR